LRIHRLGDLFGGRAAVADVVFDAEVAVRAAGIMAGREHDAAEGAVLADHAADGRRGQDTALSDQDAAHAVGGGHVQDGLDGAAVEVTAVAAEYESLAGEVAQGKEDGFDKVLEVARLLEFGHLLAQARGARTLSGEWRGRHGMDRHAWLLCMNSAINVLLIKRYDTTGAEMMSPDIRYRYSYGGG